MTGTRSVCIDELYDVGMLERTQRTHLRLEAFATFGIADPLQDELLIGMRRVQVPHYEGLSLSTWPK